MIEVNAFGLIGGTVAVWIRPKEDAGTVTLKATHPVPGAATATFALSAAIAESV